MGININIPNETIALWLSDLFKKEADEANGAASNEHLFALGSDDNEASEQHEKNTELNRQYAEILKNAYDDVQKFWRSDNVAAEMSSDEIRLMIAKKLDEVSFYKEALNKAIDREKKAKEAKVVSDLKDAIHKIWNEFWKDIDHTESELALNNSFNSVSSLILWIEADIEYALKRSKMQGLGKIKEIIKDIEGINLDKCLEAGRIRCDFASALKNVKHGSELSGKLGYGFSTDDLVDLMNLHKKNMFRRKIEDLLEDCNFHTESGLLSEGNYSECAKILGCCD